MSNIRLFYRESLSLNLTATLDKSQSHYISKVMRIKENEVFSLFNSGGEWEVKILSIAKIESDRLIADSYVLQEAVIEANALIKKAEDEAQAYRAQIEDQIDAKLTEVLNKFEQINNFVETEKKSLRQPRKIVEPE